MKNIKLALMSLGVLAAFNAQAFTDNDARKAILELREQLKGTVQTVQEQQNRISQLSDELAKLRGQYEQSQNLLNEVKNDQASGYASVDKRLAALEPIPVEQLAQQDFDKALAIVQKGNYSGALKAFDAHAKAYPNSAQTAEVSYWRGTAAYGTRNYKAAITHLSGFLSQYPNHEKSADALLTLGSAQIESGKKPVGMATLKQLVSLYPDSPAAKTAVSIINGK